MRDSHTPYFYIIRHIPSNKLYAGSKWAADSNPTTFMTPCGYCTSSNEIHKLIDAYGLESFEILRIDTNCDGIHVYEYETLFLSSIDCANDDNWINKHNNDGMAFGTPRFKKLMMDKFGVDCYNKTHEGKTRISEVQNKLVEAGVHNFIGNSFSREKVENGTHFFLDKELASARTRKRLDDGTHPFLDKDLMKEVMSKRVNSGTHNFQGESGSKLQKDRVANGTHHMLGGKIQRETQLRNLENGTHITQIRKNRPIVSEVSNLYKLLNIPKPKGMYMKNDTWMETKLVELTELINNSGNKLK